MIIKSSDQVQQLPASSSFTNPYTLTSVKGVDFGLITSASTSTHTGNKPISQRNIYIMLCYLMIDNSVIINNYHRTCW
jgi:hypothetical protein